MSLSKIVRDALRLHSRERASYPLRTEIMDYDGATWQPSPRQRYYEQDIDDHITTFLANDLWDFATLFPNDGNDLIIIKSASCFPLATSALSYVDISEESSRVVLLKIHINPTYITYGGLDRQELYYPGCPIKLTELTKYLFIISNARLYGIWQLDHATKVNRAMQYRGATRTLGGWYWIRARWGEGYYDSYSSAAGAETDIAKADLGVVYDISKLSIRIKAYIDVAAAGSFVKGYYSTDDVTYTEWFSTGDLPTSWTTYHYSVANVTARYIKLTINSAVTTSTAYCRVFKLFAWV